ncbi:hypothetical protein [Myxococcus sp. RHSTA-1-4]|uniref:hypothetical protein n=1 Tax=Myxococcus sp. RHSTA-1-4 TaxID=2874601 RepID=UPI001CC13486|nr:hypothetical protein [Myxococcus sp. RHSTA-1-4]MBZ4416005.1 hypothetical protein [Myxococcus sp. RHSTA-1-4]
MADTKWFFPSTQGGEESGLNEPGIEFFRQPGALARETLQNSGDAWDGGSNPVTVTFELLDLPIEQFPGVDRLREVIQSCRNYVLTPYKDERQKIENGRDWFEEALKLLAGTHVPVLRIRDEHTTGLEGSEHDEDKAWVRLIKKQGSAAMHGAGGGTYGIGQRAPFAFSRLRTVFYSTRTRDGKSAFIGKTILSSFREGEEVFRPIGFWGNQVERGRGVYAVRSDEHIPAPFRRSTVGTDLYIMGFSPEGWRVRVVDSVIRNFFAAIHGGRLVVRLVGGGEPIEISARTIEQVVETRLKEALQAAGSRKGAQKEVRDTLGATRHYLKALGSPVGGKPFEFSHSKLGRVQLYVAMDDDAPSRTAFMRTPRILVYERTQNLLNGYAAVFLCEDSVGNEVLARMEDPAHSEWNRERIEEGDRIISEINSFVRGSLKKLAEKDPDEPQDLPDLGRYLPEDSAIRPGARQRGARVRTDRVTEDETARHQQPKGAKRAKRTQKLPGGPQVLLLPIESGDLGESDNLSAAQDGEPVGANESGASHERTSQGGAQGHEEAVTTAGVGLTGAEGPGELPGTLGRESSVPGNREGSRGGPGPFGPEGPGSIEWPEAQRGAGPSSEEGGSASAQVGGQDATTGSDTAPGSRGSGLRALSPSRVSFRAWFSPEERTTHLLLRSTRRGRATLRLVASGEDSDYELQISSAFDVRTGEQFKCVGDRILDLAFEAEQRRELRLDLRPARRVALSIEVDHGA